MFFVVVEVEVEGRLKGRQVAHGPFSRDGSSVHSWSCRCGIQAEFLA